MIASDLGVFRESKDPAQYSIFGLAELSTVCDGLPDGFGHGDGLHLLLHGMGVLRNVA